MRRNTLKVGIDFSDYVVKPLKKYSCRNKPKMSSAG